VQSQVGRRHERTRLAQRLEEACAGQPRVVLVTGEPGIGKSTLVSGLRTIALAERCRVLSGHCVQGLHLPYAPLADTLLPEIRSRIAGWRRQNDSFATLETFLASWPPRQGDEWEEGDASTAKYLLSEALLRLCTDRAVVILIDDLHWCDRPTADLLLQTAIRAGDRAYREPVPLLIVATLRSGESATVRQHVARLRREPICSTIDLRGLDRLETGELLATQGIAGLTTEAVTRIHHVTRGNPLYVETIAQSLLVDDLSASQLDFHDVDLPAEVSEAIDQAIARLDASTVEVLRVAAVLDDAIHFDLLRRATGAPDAEIRAAVDSALASGLLRRSADSIDFAHPLHREALRSSLAPWRAREVHLAIATSMREQSDEVPISLIASHLASAGALADPSDAVPLLDAAARQAEGLYAWDEAVRLLDAALALRSSSARDDRTVDLLRRAGRARFYAGEPMAGLERLREAGRLADGLGLSSIAMQLTVDRVHWESAFRNIDPDADIGLIERELKQLEVSDPALCARGLAQLAQYRWGSLNFDDGERLALLALDCATAHGIHDAAEAALRSLAMVDWRHLRLHQANERLEQAREHSKACDDRTIAAGPASRLPIVKIWLGDLDGARRGISEAMAVASETNYLVEESLPRMARLYLETLEGEFDAALGLAADIFFLERMTGYPWTAALARPMVARLRVLQGDWSAAHNAIDEWEGAGSGTPTRQRASRMLRARAMAGEGRRDDVAAAIEAEPRIDRSWRSLGGDAAAATMIEMIDVLGLDWPVDDALQLLASVDEDQLFTTTFVQLIPRVRGDALLLQGRIDDACEELSKAAAIARRCGAWAELASCHFSLARASGAQLQAVEAEHHLQQATRLNRGRQPELVRRIDDFARRAGLSLGAPGRSGFVAPEADETVVMFIDIVDSTRLAWELGDTRFRALATRLDHRVRRAVGHHGGRAVEGVNVGDGLLAEFTSAAAALDCAGDCVDLSLEEGLSLHVGLNCGGVVRERGTVFGTTVNVAARVTGQSGANEILVTQALLDSGARPFGHFTDKGLVELKGLPEPIRLYVYDPATAAS
jgi:class 3 adenylate cyclase